MMGSEKIRRVSMGVLVGCIFPAMTYFFDESQLIYLIYSAPFVLGVIFLATKVKQDKNSELQSSKELFQLLFDSSPYPCMFFNAKGIVDCNLATIQILGAKDKETVLSKHPSEFSPQFQPDGSDSREKSIEMDRLARENGFHRFHWMHQTFSGHDLPVEVSLKPVALKDGPALLVQWRDLTEEKKSRASLEEAIHRLDFYRSALDQAAIVSMTDENGVITFVNDKFTEISGYTREELVGQNYRILNSGYHDKIFFKDLWETISSGKTWRGEICNKSKNGKVYWVDTVIVPRLDFRGKVTQYVAIRYDITLRKQAEAKLWTTTEMRRAILEGANYSIVSTDTKGTILSFNKAAEKWLGYKAEDVIGKFSPEVFHYPEEIEARAAILSYELGNSIDPGFSVFTEKARRFNIPDENEWTYVRKDGTRFPVRASVSSLYGENGELIGYLEIAQDITDSKRTHNQLIQANQMALNSVKAKNEFFANMSHEIRTPMNGVVGMCNLLLGEISEPAHVEKLKIIQNCGNALLDLINDILDFSKLEAGRVELENEPFPIHETVLEIVELLNSKASEKGLTLSYKKGQRVPSWILGDVTRFRQILLNLVSNAVKFTKIGSVTIATDCESHENGQLMVRCSVKDTGIGIPEKAKSKLFSSFSQADASTTRKFGGTGLGLAICKGLSEKMGGAISVESEEGKGSTFTFSFLAVETEARESQSDLNPFKDYENSGADFKSLKILLAEDNRINQQVACGLLKKLGCVADVAANGNEVLASLKQKSYDLILMDCHMPEKDGFEATRQICQKYPKSQRPRIIALSASTMKEDVDRCFASGMDGFLSKPVTVAALLKTLHECKDIKGKISDESNESRGSFSLQSFNREKFLENSGASEEAAMRMAQAYLDSLPKLMTDLRAAMKNGNRKPIQEAAQALRIAAQGLCAERIVEIAFKIEIAGRNGHLSRAKDLLLELIQEEDLLIKSITPFLVRKVS